MEFALSPDTKAWEESLTVLAKNLPPSAAQLRLLVLGQEYLATALQTLRPDIAPIDVGHGEGSLDAVFSLPENSVDAVVAHSLFYRLEVQDLFLQAALRVLRPGGRLILLDPAGDKPAWGALKGVWKDWASSWAIFKWQRDAHGYERLDTSALAGVLQEAGFARILTEKILGGYGILGRGEKPHVAASTMARVAVGAKGQDNLEPLSGEDLLSIQGRYIHLLIWQTPNKPVWEDDFGTIEWQAAIVEDVHHQPLVLGFSSLPKAVAFMQEAVMVGAIQGINKIAKFSKETASAWAWGVLMNPTLEMVKTRYTLAGRFVKIDPQLAERPDE